MILFTINDNLSKEKSPFLQCVDSVEMIKRELLINYKKLIDKKDIAQLEKLKDLTITFFGSFNGEKIEVYPDSQVKPIEVLDFIGVNKNENI